MIYSDALFNAREAERSADPKTSATIQCIFLSPLFRASVHLSEKLNPKCSQCALHISSCIRSTAAALQIPNLRMCSAFRFTHNRKMDWTSLNRKKEKRVSQLSKVSLRKISGRRMCGTWEIWACIAYAIIRIIINPSPSKCSYFIASHLCLLHLSTHRPTDAAAASTEPNQVPFQEFSRCPISTRSTPVFAVSGLTSHFSAYAPFVESVLLFGQ